jgi:hypothetical protein
MQQNGEQNQPQTLLARPKSTQTTPILTQLSYETQPVPSGRKSPAYLQGRNPYGQVLNKVEHPYRKPKDTAEGPPSQSSANVFGRPRTSGSFEFRTRPAPVRPEQTTSAPDAQQKPPPPRYPPTPVSVQATREFFESRAILDRQRCLQTPAGEATATRSAPAKTTEYAVHPPLSFDEDPPRITSPKTPHTPGRRSDIVLSITCPPQEAATHVVPSQRTNPFARPKAKVPPSSDVDREATERQDPLSSQAHILQTNNIQVYKPSTVRMQVEKTGPRGLSYDGSSSEPDLSRQRIHHSHLPIASVSAAGGIDDVKIPDDVDSRSGYGRRKTKDFGFPGAQKDAKPRAKRSHGHSTPKSKPETREQARQDLHPRHSSAVLSSSSGSSRERHSRVSTARYPSRLPKTVEKLNVGVPGQTTPNINDTFSALRERVKSVPDLINFVNSAADNFGVDLDRRPSAQDDQNFQNAPFESMHRASDVPPRRKSSAHTEEGLLESKQASDGSWLQQSCKSLAELSEVRKLLMCDLDSLAEDFGEQVYERGVFNPATDPLQRVRSRMFTGMKKQPIDPTVDDSSKLIEHQIDKLDLNQVLTRMAAHLNGMMAITQKLQKVVKVAPEVIRMAPPADPQVAIEFVTDKLKSDYETLSEVSGEHSQCESRDESEAEDAQHDVEYEDQPDSEYEEELDSDNQEDCHESSLESQDHVTESDDHSHNKTSRASSPSCSNSEPLASLEHEAQTSSILSTSSEGSAEQYSAEELDQPNLERFETSRTTMPHHRRSPISQEVGTDQSFSSDL